MTTDNSDKIFNKNYPHYKGGLRKHDDGISGPAWIKRMVKLSRSKLAGARKAGKKYLAKRHPVSAKTVKYGSPAHRAKISAGLKAHHSSKRRTKKGR